MKGVFDYYFDQVNYSMHIPAFFDPRYKKSVYEGMSQEDILNTMQNLQFQFNNLTTSETRNYFQSLFMTNNNQSIVENELEIYFSSNPPSLDIMPLEWWKIHSNSYPILSQMAKDYLTVMATSVPCEQLFSIAGKQITPTRNRLNPDTAQVCLCLKSWLEQEIVK